MTQRVEPRRPGTLAPEPAIITGALPAAANPEAPTVEAPIPPPPGQQLAARGAPSRGAQFAGARGTHQQAVERALAPLAQAAGLDAGEFAARFTAQHPALQGKQLEARAIFAFVQEALARYPERADALIAVRLRGVSGERLALVEADIEASGTSGRQRYAQAERAIKLTAEFTGEQLGDIAGMVHAGESLSGAVKKERAELDRIAREEAATKESASAAGPGPTLDDLRIGLERREDVRKRSVEADMREAAGLWRRAGTMTRSAEFAVGVGLTKGWLEKLPPTLYFLGQLPGLGFSELNEEIAKSSRFVDGKFTEALNAARVSMVGCVQAAVRYEEARQEWEQACADGVPDINHPARARMDAACADLKRHLSDLRVRAPIAEKLQAEFEGATLDVAQGELMSAALGPVAAELAVPLLRSLGPTSRALAEPFVEKTIESGLDWMLKQKPREEDQVRRRVGAR